MSKQRARSIFKVLHRGTLPWFGKVIDVIGSLFSHVPIGWQGSNGEESNLNQVCKPRPLGRHRAWVVVLSALQYGTKGSRWCSTLRHSELLSGPIVPSGVWYISFYPIYTYIMYIQRHTKTPFVITHRELFVTGILRISKFRAAHGTFHQSNAWLLGSRVNPCLDLCLVTIYQVRVAACWLWGSCHCEVTLQLHEHCCKTWCIPTSLTDCNTCKKTRIFRPSGAFICSCWVLLHSIWTS